MNMSPNDTVYIKPSYSWKHYCIGVFTVVVASALVGAGFLFFRSHKTDNSPLGEPITIVPFSENLVLSLEAPVKDKEGIPYSGMVHYNPNTQTFSYISSSDGGVVRPVGIGAFTGDGHYIAQRMTASSSDVVLYNRNTLSPERIISKLSPQYLVGTAVWSMDTKKFAYYLVDSKGARLEVETLAGDKVGTLPPQYPIGFSPDATKLLVRQGLDMFFVDLGTKNQVVTSGSVFLDSESKFQASPSGRYLIAQGDTQIDWYSIDWTTAQLTHQGMIPLKTPDMDVLFSFDDTLIIHDSQSELFTYYEYREGEGVLLKNVSQVKVPAGAQILKVVPW